MTKRTGVLYWANWFNFLAWAGVNRHVLADYEREMRMWRPARAASPAGREEGDDV